MKCVGCNGTGDVKPIGYRESANMPEVEVKVEPKVSRPWKEVWKETWLFNFLDKFFCEGPGIPVVIVGTVIVVALCLCVHWDNTERIENKIAQNIEAKKGYVVAQYATDGSVSKCWIIRDRNNIQGYTMSIAIPDITNPNSTTNPAAIGVSDATKCLKIVDQ